DGLVDLALQEGVAEERVPVPVEPLGMVLDDRGEVVAPARGPAIAVAAPVAVAARGVHVRPGDRVEGAERRGQQRPALGGGAFRQRVPGGPLADREWATGSLAGRDDAR